MKLFKIAVNLKIDTNLSLNLFKIRSNNIPVTNKHAYLTIRALIHNWEIRESKEESAKLKNKKKREKQQQKNPQQQSNNNPLPPNL